jgi:hypothetical protein
MPEIQDFVDSLCQCFGTTNGPRPPGQDHYRRSGGSSSSKQQNLSSTDRHSTTASASETKKSSNRIGAGCNSILVIPERQLEALKLTSQRVSCFNGAMGDVGNDDPNGVNDHSKQSTPPQSRKLQKKNSKTGRLSSSSSNNNINNTLNTSNHGSSASHKRRRSSNGSSRVDDIFRSKTRVDSFSANSSGNYSNGGTQANPFSRFLSNHPVIMNSLCFATPVKGDSADDHNNPQSTATPVDAHSVISQCDDEEEDDNTMTSTVFYETTKLAGLRQTSPPMPLFKHFAVDPEHDDINKIVATHSHSSAKLIDMFQNFHKSCLQKQIEEEEETMRLAQQSKNNTSGVPVPLIKLEKQSTSLKVLDRTSIPNTPNHRTSNSRFVRNGNSLNESKFRLNLDPMAVVDDYDDMNPPPMMHCSSSSSKSSKSSVGGCGTSDGKHSG